MEIWKEIVYDGVTYDGYQVSNLGRIKSLWFGKEKILKTCKDGRGYLQVVLYKDGKKKTFRVHRLVASTFLTNPENKPDVNHKDEDKTNNFVGTPENDYKDGNLEWCDKEYNDNYGTRNERVGEALSKPVLQFTLDGEFVREWSSTRECGRNGFNQGNVGSCCNGKLKSSSGYVWKYK